MIKKLNYKRRTSYVTPLVCKGEGRCCRDLKENRNYCQFFINECYKNMGKYVFIDPSD